MLIRSLLAVSVAAYSLGVQAAPERTALNTPSPATTFVKFAAAAAQSRYVDVEVLRDYADTVTLGNDSDSGAPLYSHRSVTLTYRVDCVAGTLAVADWQMFDGNFGQGQVIWNQENRNGLAFVPAVNNEMRAVLRSACTTTKVAG